MQYTRSLWSIDGGVVVVYFINNLLDNYHQKMNTYLRNITAHVEALTSAIAPHQSISCVKYIKRTDGMHYEYITLTLDITIVRHESNNNND